MIKLSALVALVAAAVYPASAHADNWIVGELPAAVAVGGVQEEVYRPGLMPAVGGYHEVGPDGARVAFGLRMRLGALRNGPAPAMLGAKDPGVGGLAAVGAALRLTRGPAWVEGVVGAGMTGPDWVPALEAGAGWTYRTGALDVGPSVRLLHVGSRDQMDSIGSANVILVGIDARFGRDRPPRGVVRAAAFVPPAIAPVVAPPTERDGDVILDADVGCAVDAEGCPVAGELVLHDDRIVLDDRVLFDFGHARVRSPGRDVVAAIASAWRAHPEWKRITVEGHADVRGSDDYNQALSQHRAENVKAQLVKNGFAAERIDAIGYGRSRPRDTGSTEEAHGRNRRVEFVIDREGLSPSPPAKPAGNPPHASASLGDRVGVAAEVTP